jgi:hypothetical protein
MTIAADPRRLGARVGMTSVLHTWGSALTHHPHIHMIVPGGGLSPDGTRWVPAARASSCTCGCSPACSGACSSRGCGPASARARSGLLRRPGQAGDAAAFAAWLAPFRKSEWVVYAKPPFGGPEAVLAYLSRYTHRVAISNSRLISADAETVAFRWKDYRIKTGDRRGSCGSPRTSSSAGS